MNTDSQLIRQYLAQLDTAINQLKVKYDLYFQGIERIAPENERKDIERQIRRLLGVQIRNTGDKFKFQTLVQKFNSLKSYWDRILLQIERGTYSRDRFRADLHGMSSTQKTTEERKQDRKAAGGNDVDGLFKEYVKAKDMCLEDTKRLNVDGFRKTIETQIPKLKKAYGAKDIKFKVVVENGKAKLKATPVK